MFTRVHHVGLVVRRLEDGLALWRDTFGLVVSAQATVADQGVKAALLPIGRSEIELLEPIDPNGGVAKFLEKRGEGLHHVCLETPDVAADLAAARAAGLPLIDQAPRRGLAGMIGFLHPKGTCGVLTEFATPPHDAHRHEGPCGAGALADLALREVTARTAKPDEAAQLFRDKLGLGADTVTPDPGTRAAAVTVGGVRLHFVAPPAADATADTAERAADGLAGLVLELPSPIVAERALAARGAERAGLGLVLDPRRCHGVPIALVAPA